MEIQGLIILIVFFLPAILLSIDFIQYLFREKKLYNIYVYIIIEVVSITIFPLIYLALDDKRNDCCTESATFSPDHSLTIYTFILISVVAYLISAYKQKILSPIIEVLINTILLFGFILNIFVAIQINVWFLSLLANLPIGLLFLFQLLENHKQFLLENKEFESSNLFEQFAWKILNLNIFVKIPIFLVLCIPFVTIISALLLLFGQKPDSIVRSFTETYKHGFSQLDYLCENVECGGHFLCSVAANGHKNIVKPIRYGERNGKKIICNRQLLIANAFEQLLQESFPKIHKIIRKNYNKIGNQIHKHYHFFNNKFISDAIYILMKPAEKFFLFTLYTFDKKPENRIATQYCKQYKIVNYQR
jgi:hypothetical protein